MRHTALCRVYACASEVFLRHCFSGDCLDNSRSGKEHVGSVLYHDVEVGQGRGVNGSSGTWAEYAGNLRHYA